jgi:ribosome recycling factor
MTTLASSFISISTPDPPPPTAPSPISTPNSTEDAQAIRIARLEEAFQSLTKHIQRIFAHHDAALNAMDEDPTGLIILSSLSSSFQERQKQVSKLLEQCRIIVQRLQQQHYQQQSSTTKNNPINCQSDLRDRLSLYQLQLQTLTQSYHETIDDMKKRDDELTLYIEENGDAPDDEDDEEEVDYDVNDAYYVDDHDDYDFTSWEDRPECSTPKSSEVYWSTLDESFSEMDALVFTIE